MSEGTSLIGNLMEEKFYMLYEFSEVEILIPIIFENIIQQLSDDLIIYITI
jgi:hypothetical protein